MSSKRLENINRICCKVKETLSQLFQTAGYEITKDEYHKEVFGSRFYVWTNKKDKHCFRLVWDGRDQWLILEESPFITNEENVAWADHTIVPVDPNIDDQSYIEGIVESVIVDIDIKN